jgi:hypothetical protein
MSNDDPAFSTRVLSTQDLPRPLIIKTVGEAIDLVNDLPEATRALPHWQQARIALYEAYPDHAAGATCPPPDPGKVKAAEEAFRAALKKEHWLIEPVPPNPIGVLPT